MLNKMLVLFFYLFTPVISMTINITNNYKYWTIFAATRSN